jgi:hypothetical protein
MFVMSHCSANQSNPKGFGTQIKFREGPNIAEEFSLREAVRGGQTLYMSAGMHEDLKKHVPAWYAAPGLAR